MTINREEEKKRAFKQIIEQDCYLFLWLGSVALSAKVLVIVFSFKLFIVQPLFELRHERSAFTQTPFAFHRTLWGHRMSEGSCPAPFCLSEGTATLTMVSPPPPGGETPPSDLWSGKTDELLLPPCFFARSILHVGVCFMNDGDLLKPSIQLPKDAAPGPPQHLYGRNKAITLLNRGRALYAHTRTQTRTCPHEYTDEATESTHTQIKRLYLFPAFKFCSEPKTLHL